MLEIKEALERALPRIAIRLRNELVKVCPVDKGFLSWSIKVEARENSLIITMLDYGKYVEFGTPPHLIKPKDKKALHWGGDNGPVTKVVKHPGTRPNPFIRNTLRNKFGQIVQEEILKSL
jgi:hypothetical protein